MIKVRLVGVPHPALDTDPSVLETAPIDVASAFDAVVAARKAEADAEIAAAGGRRTDRRRGGVFPGRQ